ncbi:DUF6434 domain-containing protein [Litoreibacter ponti]|uniref:DUF6434 domain-containing protein n=1 Tax=Litoreibacter ponti TaxID=1510457 RepID=UPI0011B21148|nr:DUF6434 domain-containing protein [Litoreibacter ponti]
MSEARPDITTLTTGAELRRWYWRKEELVAHAKRLKLKSTGGKFDILDRIAQFLDTGEVAAPATPKPKSKFDWHSAPLSPETIITDSYRNSQNVRRFFKSQLGDSFKFNIEFMAWMKANVGLTLADACAEYRAMKTREADPNFQSQIAHHNQFNQYTRDFLAAHPEASLEDVRTYWALKIQQPSETGRHEYHPDDLKLR